MHLPGSQTRKRKSSYSGSMVSPDMYGAWRDDVLELNLKKAGARPKSIPEEKRSGKRCRLRRASERDRRKVRKQNKTTKPNNPAANVMPVLALHLLFAFRTRVNVVRKRTGNISSAKV